MVQHSNIRLSSAEIGALWTTYLNDSLTSCFLKYFIHHLKDEEIKPIVARALQISEGHMDKIKNIFIEEGFPIPVGYSDHELDLTTPPLYYDLYALSFVYGMSRIGLLAYGALTATIARQDVLHFFSQCAQEANELYKDSIQLELSKGIYDRPPMIPYPTKTDFVERESFLTGWFGERRPINTTEITNIFFNIERNYFAVILLQGFIQVTQDKEIKNFFIKGKELAEKQINIFNKILMEEDLLGSVPVSMEVTDSTSPPFSDRLMVSLITSLNGIGVSFIGSSLASSMRRDLSLHYSRHIVELLKFGEEGTLLTINRGWLEQPPQAPNRKSKTTQTH